MDDLAVAAFAACGAPATHGRAYAVPGGETLPYLEMVARGFGDAASARLQEDLVFDAGPANRDFGYAPRAFAPTAAMFEPAR